MRRPRGKEIAAGLVAALAIAPAAHASHARITHLSPGGGTGADGRGISFQAASLDAAAVFFDTRDTLTADDRDGGASDIYEHSPAGVRLVSTGPSEPADSSSSSNFGGSSEDGRHVFFNHQAALVPEDTDNQWDVYEREGDTVRLVSTGPRSSPGDHWSWYEAASADGARVIFHTTEQLVAEDDDTEVDVYAREAGVTELVSRPPGAANSARSAGFLAASRDARVIVYHVADPPPDYSSDMYVTSPSDTLAVPGGPWTDGFEGPGFGGISADGTHVFYETAAQLVPQDTDMWEDLYDFSSGSVELVSQGPAADTSGYTPVFKGASADGSHVFFWTALKLVPEDTDSAMDVYDRSGGETRLVSTGPAGGNGPDWAWFSHITTDGETAFFHTNETLTLDDQDGKYQDVYARSGGTTTLVSNTKPTASSPAELRWVSADGRRMILTVAGYEARTDGVAHTLGPDVTASKAVSEDAARVVFATDRSLLGSDQDSVTDLYEIGPGDPTRYARPKAASPVRVALVPAYEECTAPNMRHASGSLASNGCNPATAESRSLTVGTAGFNGEPASSRGELTLSVRTGDPATPEDEADVGVRFEITDVRRSADLSDYTGQLEIRVLLRLTDLSHGPELSYPGTSEDIEFAFRAPCTATAADVGATCTLDSSLRGLRCCVPRLEGKRTVMKVDDVRVFDSGPDGNISTSSDNDVFAWPGLFIP